MESVKKICVSDLSGKEIANVLPNAVTKLKLVSVTEIGNEHVEIEFDCLPTEAGKFVAFVESAINNCRKFTAAVDALQSKLGPNVPSGLVHRLVAMGVTGAAVERLGKPA